MHNIMSLFHVTAIWDDEAEVWVAEAQDFPGLIAQSPTVEGLIQELASVAPDLAELNHVPITDGNIQFNINLSRCATIPLAA